ncbi:1,5-anhydro-D-fructose reductase (1,5-anhydro-D-mannitol-forming) [Asanoa ferruginea]|uniref:1,5-anhydro-D-fructose reductase (1,5-anhydro-D-mannitol-forming) n=1 Tax=Asanoa ferruginea TaxID=53367 RepID=A0A3D9ZB60_9ACTN|nr:Gfo/Idh/MocA family oxidoreductase [Asanoa ferruginea]REF94169.1 1,5-anhydro-D-fructose reductase (1,5-anhydro-D-mannitol-forming) [Asanoa ferruginea]GIF49886.1 oxidoreductase [Asanoa ferruginea]
MSQVGVGIIGTGYIATACHGPAVMASPSARLAAVLSRSEAGGRDFLRTFDASDARPYSDLDAFLADPEIELVVIASPDGLHFPQAAASLRAGKHVLVEKPIAVSEAEARSLVDLASAQGLVLASGYHLRCHPGHVALRERVRAGALGTIRHLRVMWSFPIAESNWRARSDIARWWSLSATGTHCLDLARWFADDLDDWAQFTAVLSNTRWQAPRDESAAIAAQLASGPTVEVLSSVQFEIYTRVEIFGDRGIAVCADTLGPEGGGEVRLNGERLDFTPGSPFVPQLAAVLGAIAGQGGPPADGMVGLRAIKDLELAAG